MQLIPHVKVLKNERRTLVLAVAASLILVLLFKIHSFQYPELFQQISSHATNQIASLQQVATSILPNPPIDFLPLAESIQFCQNRRWPIWEERSNPRKIYDLFLINTELDWLEIRLGELYDHVDYFIIVEANTTFQDTSKPLFVQENWDQFKRYHKKMIRHTLNLDGVIFRKTWDREKFSRNALYNQVFPHLEGIQAASIGDVMLVSDIDELPRPSTLTALRNCDFPRKLSLHSAMYYYSFQWWDPNNWNHPQATFFNGNETVLPQDLRDSSDSHLYNAAWHCSYCFSTVEEMVAKITSFSHAEFNKPIYKDHEKIIQRIRNGLDIFGRRKSHLYRIEENLDVPEFLMANKETYKFVLDRDPENANFRDA